MIEITRLRAPDHSNLYWCARIRGRRGVISVHRLVWQTIHGPIPKGMQVHHIDENKLNNHISNLELLPIGVHQGLHLKNKPKSEETKEKMRKIWASMSEEAKKARQLPARLAAAAWRNEHPEESRAMRISNLHNERRAKKENL